MKNLSKWLAVSAATVTIAGLGLGGTALADPTGDPQHRQLVGVGSDTTEEVMNGLANAITIDGVKVLGSFNATGGAFDARNPATLPAGKSCSYLGYEPTANGGGGNNGPGVRANGSSAGRARLLDALAAGDPKAGCLDFARSSSLNTAAAATQLTYIPFGTDGQAYATRTDSSIGKTLSLATLKAIYQCQGGASFIPMLPQAGSGTRQSWLQTLGLTEATYSKACVKETWVDPSDGLTKPIQEHDGRVLQDRRNIVPFSVAQFAAQSAGSATDKRGKAQLNHIEGAPSFAANVGGAATRKSYNVIPTARVGDTANHATLNQVFVGSTSEICKAASIIGRYGLAPAQDCGSVATKTQ